MIPIPTSARDIASINRTLGLIRQKGVSVGVHPIMRRMIITDFSLETQGGTASQFSYSKNVTLSKEFLRQGYTVHVAANGDFYRNSGTSTIQFWVYLDSNDIIEFAVIPTPDSSTVYWTLDAYIMVVETGGSGNITAFGHVFLNGLNTAQGSGVIIDTTPDHLLQINVQHGSSSDASVLRSLIVDVMQS